MVSKKGRGQICGCNGWGRFFRSFYFQVNRWRKAANLPLFLSLPFEALRPLRAGIRHCGSISRLCRRLIYRPQACRPSLMLRLLRRMWLGSGPKCLTQSQAGRSGFNWRLPIWPMRPKRPALVSRVPMIWGRWRPSMAPLFWPQP